MRGKSSNDFTFDAEPEKTLHAKLRQARKARLAALEVEILDSGQEKEVERFKHSDT